MPKRIKPKVNIRIRNRALYQAWAKLGTSSMNRVTTAMECARRTGEVFPDSKDAQWDVIRRFVGLESSEFWTPKPVTMKAVRKFTICPNSDAFLDSYEWRRLRMEVLKEQGRRCACCGATPNDGVRMHVDHIKPRRKYPELALVKENLQVLCEVCNHGKGNWDETDWRKATG